jgi:broad specificity phosphatase PhoE
MSTIIYFTRHGETKWNSEGRMQGQKGSSLTLKGQEQTLKLKDRLKNKKIDIVYTSNSKRAVETTNILCNGKKIKVIESRELMEMDFGKWEGMLFDEIKQKYPDNFNYFWNKPLLYKPEGGESFNELIKRVHTVLDKILDDNENKSILVVTHTVVLKCILSILEKRSIENIWEGDFIHPVSLTKVIFENKEEYKICYIANASHLN